MTLHRRVVYLAGPFRSKATPYSHWEQWQNILRAEELSLQVWLIGAACICPHLNTAHYQGAAPDDVWIDGDLEILRRCDAILMTPDWERSSGARSEHEFAREHRIPIYYSISDLSRDLESIEPTEESGYGAGV